MNSLLNLGRCLGDVSSPAFVRYYQYQVVQSLGHQDGVRFVSSVPDQTTSVGRESLASRSTSVPDADSASGVAHQSGTNCLAIDSQTGQYLVTGGADSTVRLWDLEGSTKSSSLSGETSLYHPVATLTRFQPSAHTHALTSVSIYPFDPTPTTLITTSYDKSILLSAISPTSIQAVHKTSLDFTPHTHAISPHPASSPLVAIGTTHPAIRLLDLRTGLATHSLPGHNGAIYALSFHPSPTQPNLLISGSVDGRILLFDIRRANPAFASLDLDDAVGFSSSSFASPESSRASHLHLDYGARAHSGPVTGIAPLSTGTHLISAGHDNRIRVWDLSTGANSLVHFGPRIRNSRNGHLSPLILPATFGKTGKETLLWPNDDTRGEIFMHSVREGTSLSVMRTKGVDRSNIVKKSQSTKGRGGTNAGKVTNRGRINQLALRYSGDESTGDVVEVYSAHGDGSVCAWKPDLPPDQDDEVEGAQSRDPDRVTQSQSNAALTAEETSRKRKRDLIGDLVEGLTKKPITFT